jgi:hypothetical protein
VRANHIPHEKPRGLPRKQRGPGERSNYPEPRAHQSICGNERCENESYTAIRWQAITQATEIVALALATGMFTFVAASLIGMRL